MQAPSDPILRFPILRSGQKMVAAAQPHIGVLPLATSGYKPEE